MIAPHDEFPPSPTTTPPPPSTDHTATEINNFDITTTSSSPAPRRAKPRVRGGKYFTDELLHLFHIMTLILPTGPLEWEKVTEMHLVKFPGRDIDSLRWKYTSTHRRKVPRGDPNFPPEVREAKWVKVAIWNKAKLAGCTEEYDMEVELDGIESDSVVARVHNVGVSSDTKLSLSPHRGGLRVRGRKFEKPDLMGILVMLTANDASAREESRKDRAEDRKKAEEDRREVAKYKGETAKEKVEDRRDLTMMIASIAGGYFGLERKKKRSRNRRRRRHWMNDDDNSSSNRNSADIGDGMDSPSV